MKRLCSFITLLVGVLTLSFAQDDDAKYATELLKPSTEAPNFTFNDNGKATSLKDLRGSYVVLDFWATWCGDCRKDMPAMESIYADFSQKGIRFVGISFDKNREALDKYISENNIAWPQYFDGKSMRESPMNESYKIKWIPTVYILDKEGRVVLATVMIDKVRAKLNEICNIQ